MAADIFITNASAILAGNFNSTLLDEVEKVCPQLKNMHDISVVKIYNHPSVVEVELAGYNVLGEILSVFVESMLSSNRSPLEKKYLQLIPEQFNLAYEMTSPYEKTMAVLDFVSGMTDGYATELYRKLKGIDIPTHK
jgi:dGTPase